VQAYLDRNAEVLTETNRPPRKTVLVTGSSGFIGSRLVNRLLAHRNHDIVCMTRNPSTIEEKFGISGEIIRTVRADAANYGDLLRALEGVDLAFYLIHSMEGSSKDWKRFAERDKIAAQNFARVITQCNVKRIVYLGGLIDEGDGEMSIHMRSRKEVGEILKTSSAQVTIFRAAVILGQGGGSFQMLRYLVERLPIMVCPKWVLTKSQPIAVEDVVEYLAESIDKEETIGKTFDIGGPEVLSYIDMMTRYANYLKKSVNILIIPFLTPRLSSYWIDLITPVRAALARPLIDSLRHEAVVTNDSIRDIIPIELKSFEDAIRTARREEVRKSKNPQNERTSLPLNHKILFVSLLMLATVGSTYYFLDTRSEILQISWLILSGLWYLGVLFSMFFTLKGTRLGAIIAGILGWITLAFWLTDNFYTVFGSPIITSSPPDTLMTIRNFAGVFVAACVVISSHNIFHKMHRYGM
jgi:uncharacterized protein YbjT (DUF2867 family)